MWISAAIMTLVLGFIGAAWGEDLFVATSGSDANPGTETKPFATLERARDEIRKLKKAGPLPTGGVTVFVRGGIYELAKAFELTAEDSGTMEAPIQYRAYEREEVRLVGGRVVTGWKPVADAGVLGRLNVFAHRPAEPAGLNAGHAGLPMGKNTDESARGKVLQADLRAQGITDYGEMRSGAGGAASAQGLKPYDAGLELFFQDRPMTLARWPNEGFVKIADLVGGEPKESHGIKGDKIGKFFYEGDRPKRWAGEKDIMLHGYWFWDWSDQRQKVEAIDAERRIITMEQPYHYFGYRKGQRYYAFNLLPELDAPGEWYLDREKGILYFWPPAPIKQGKAMVSLTPTLVTMKGASHVTLRGMILEVTRRTAITISGGEGNRIVGCTLRNIATWAVSISGGKKNGVVGCDISETGDGGIMLDGGDRKTLTPAGHYAENNNIHDYSRTNRICRPGVQMNGVGNRIAHNLIHNAPHCAIMFGGNDHVIELNEIHDVCYETGDAGAIYAGYDWTMRGHMIRYNYMHHVRGPGLYGTNGVYLDDMFSSATISGTIFYEVTRAAFIGGGRDNIVENNIFVNCVPALHVDARALGWAKDSVNKQLKERLLAMPYKQPPWSERYPKLVGIWEDEPANPKGNLIARNICFGGKWDEVEEKARPCLTFEANLVGEDPHFVGVFAHRPAEPAGLNAGHAGLPMRKNIDAASANFELREDSPAYKLGFKPIPIKEIGLVNDETRASWPVTHPIRPILPR